MIRPFGAVTELSVNQGEMMPAHYWPYGSTIGIYLHDTWRKHMDHCNYNDWQFLSSSKSTESRIQAAHSTVRHGESQIHKTTSFSLLTFQKTKIPPTKHNTKHNYLQLTSKSTNRTPTTMPGESNSTTCADCHGSGQKEVRRVEHDKIDCDICCGRGWVRGENNTCPECLGCRGKGGRWIMRYVARMVPCPCRRWASSCCAEHGLSSAANTTYVIG